MTNTTGLILNGQVHLLKKTNDGDVCENCSIKEFCTKMPHCLCVILSDANDEHFVKI